MRLAEALAGELGAAVRLSAPVRRVRWSPDAVTVATDHGEIGADAVVIAIPTAPLAEIEFDPPLEGATAEALRTVIYGQNSKLFLRLRSPAPPSAIMSVAGHFWTYTQLGADGRARSLPGRLHGHEVRDRCPRWLRRVRALGRGAGRASRGPGPRSGTRQRHAFELARRPMGARLLLRAQPLLAASRRRPGEADRPTVLCRRAHGRRVARADGGSASERTAGGRTNPLVRRGTRIDSSAV